MYSVLFPSRINSSFEPWDTEQEYLISSEPCFFIQGISDLKKRLILLNNSVDEEVSLQRSHLVKGAQYDTPTMFFTWWQIVRTVVCSLLYPHHLPVRSFLVFPRWVNSNWWDWSCLEAFTIAVCPLEWYHHFMKCPQSNCWERSFLQWIQQGELFLLEVPCYIQVTDRFRFWWPCL